MGDDERVKFLERELDRAWRALCGYATAADNGVVLDKTAQAYHAPTVAAAKRYVMEGAMDGAEYFEGKHVGVLRSALSLTVGK